MTELPGKSIADRLHGRLAWQLALGAALWGVMASLVYWQQELTLSH